MRNIGVTAFIGALACLLAVSLPVAGQGMITPTGGDVEVIDRGEQPWRILRYDWPLGHTETARMEYQASISMVIEGEEYMGMTMDMTMDVESTAVDVQPDGTTRFETVYTGFDIDVTEMIVEGEPLIEEVAEVMAEAMDSMARQAVGISGWEVYDARGVVLDSGIDMPEAFPEDLRQMFDQMAAYPSILPEVAVGVGAQWKIAANVAESGLEMDATSFTEVIDIDGDTVLLEMTLGVSASGSMPADESDPDVVAGTEFEEFSMTGGGPTRVVLGRLYADTSLGIQIHTVMSMPIGEDAEASGSMDMDMDYGISPG